MVVAAMCCCFFDVAMAASSVVQGAVSPDSDVMTSAAPAAQQPWNVLGQFTSVTQFNPAFPSPYSGKNSLDPESHSSATNDLTLFAGMRIASGGELWINPEIDQGFGLNNSTGVAGFPSGEAYKVGANDPYLRLPRLFYRQTINLGGSDQVIASAANRLGGSQSSDNLTLTIGKFSVVDVFDTNSYAHDPRSDFLNWAIVDAGAFDYAADAWGYTEGGAIEWTRSRWTLRGGFFALSYTPNSTILDTSFTQHEWVAELEERHRWRDRPGKIKLLGFLNQGRMGSYDSAVQLAQQTSSTPDTALVRSSGSQSGFAVNLEQEVSDELGVFSRASMNQGKHETFEFTDINKSLSAGLAMRGGEWQRPDDTLGFAAVANGLTGAAHGYFAAGGMGILIGDGQLPHYGLEKIIETYYSCSVHAVDHLLLTLDYQYIVNPAYNEDRGPVSVLGARVHLEF
jgi:high affinity Mn2+ porin